MPWGQITSLSISINQSSPSLTVLRSCHLLRHLRVTFILMSSSNEFPPQDIIKMEHLQTLICFDYHQRSSPFHTFLLLPALSEFRTSSEMWCVLKSLRQSVSPLTKLELVSNNGTEAEVIECLEMVPTLIHLSIRDSNKNLIGNALLGHLDMSMANPTLPRLKFLEIKCSTVLDPHILCNMLDSRCHLGEEERTTRNQLHKVNIQCRGEWSPQIYNRLDILFEDVSKGTIKASQ